MPVIAKCLSRMSFCTGVITLLLCAIGAADAQTFNIHYRVSLLGLSIGTASLEGKFSGTSYHMQADAKLAGLAAAISKSSGAATAQGSIIKGEILPATYATTSANPKLTRTIRMALKNRALEAMDVSPPFESVPGRVPLTPESERNIVDPLSAAVMIVPDGQPLVGPATCNRKLPVFDGFVRFDMDLSFEKSAKVNVRGYTGPAAVCRVRYHPLAGHRPARKETQFMTNNRNIKVWLAPVAGTNISVPVQVSVATMLGTINVEAVNFNVAPSP